MKLSQTYGTVPEQIKEALCPFTRFLKCYYFTSFAASPTLHYHLPVSEPLEVSAEMMSHHPEILQCVFPKSNDTLIKKQPVAFQINMSTMVQYNCLILRPPFKFC